MNKRQKEIAKTQLEAEKEVLKKLEGQYKTALNDINKKIKEFDYDINMLDQALNEEGLDDAARAVLQSRKRSKIYQKQYQEAMKGQVSGILDKLHGDEYATIQQYLKNSYTDAFVGTAYDLAGQGIPLIMPIDQAAIVKAIQTDSKVSKGLYNALGVDVAKLKKSIQQEISRGIATGMSYGDIARNISNVSKAPLNRANVIARTEGHRIQQASTMDAQRSAKKKGADVVKQWDSTLDGKTRPTHRQLDGQIREVDEPFEIGGRKADAPGYFGDPAEDCNCRCACLTRARWALDEDELQTLKDRANFFGLDKTKSFEDFKDKYLNGISAVEAAEKAENPVKNKFGDTIIFDEKLNSEKWSESVGYIKELANEYETRLTTVKAGASHAAGSVDMGGNMRLSSAAPSTAFHEFAHSVANESLTKYGVTDDSDFWKEIKSVRRAYMKDVGDDTSRWISSYEHGSRSVDEFLAEAFTHAKMIEKGIDLPDKYGKDMTYSGKVLEIVNKYFKKKK